MNLYELIRDLHRAHSNPAAYAPVRQMLDAYDALAPEWSNAPEWAQWYAIDANGRAVWMKRKPKSGYPRNPYWEHHVAYIPEHVSDYSWAVAGEVDIADGIDWRQCLWQRPEVQP